MDTHAKKRNLLDKDKEKKPLRDENTPAKTRKVVNTNSTTSVKRQPSGPTNPINSWRQLSSKYHRVPAHYGVPVPEKMKKLSLKLLDIHDDDDKKRKAPDKIEEKKPLKDVNSSTKTKKVVNTNSTTTVKRQMSTNTNQIKSWRQLSSKYHRVPAHYGVPVPEKMKKLSLKMLDINSMNSDVDKNE